MKAIWTQGPLDIFLDIKEGFSFLLSEDKVENGQVMN